MRTLAIQHLQSVGSVADSINATLPAVKPTGHSCEPNKASLIDRPHPHQKVPTDLQLREYPRELQSSRSYPLKRRASSDFPTEAEIDLLIKEGRRAAHIKDAIRGITLKNLNLQTIHNKIRGKMIKGITCTVFLDENVVSQLQFRRKGELSVFLEYTLDEKHRIEEDVEYITCFKKIPSLQSGKTAWKAERTWILKVENAAIAINVYDVFADHCPGQHEDWTSLIRINLVSMHRKATGNAGTGLSLAGNGEHNHLSESREARMSGNPEAVGDAVDAEGAQNNDVELSKGARGATEEEKGHGGPASSAKRKPRRRAKKKQKTEERAKGNDQ